MSRNVVEIIIKASDEAVPDLDRLRMKIDELGRKAATAKVSVDDKEGAARLLSLNAQLARLDRKVSNPRIDLAGAAAAEAQIAAVDLGMDRLNDRTARTGRLLSGLSGSLQDASQNASGLSGMLISLAQGFVSLVSAGPAGWAAIVAIAGAVMELAAALGSIVPAVAAAGFGLGSFVALAIPTVTEVVKAIGKISSATTAAARDKAWDAIPQRMVPLVRGALGLKQAFDQMAAKLEPVVLRILDIGTSIANKLMPSMLRFAQIAGKAIEGLLRGFDQFASSPGFKKFIAQMETLAGPAITAIGRGLGEITISIGKMLQSMASPQSITVLTILLRGVALAIGAIGIAFEGLNKAIPAIGRAFLATGAVVLDVLHAIGIGGMDVFSGLIHAAADVAKALHLGVAGQLAADAHTMDNARQHMDDFFTRMRSDIDSAGTALRNAPKVFALQGNITDLENKLASARALLRNPDLTATRRARVEADISQLSIEIARAKAELASLQNRTVYVTTVAIGQGRSLTGGMAAGGISGAASGGLRSRLTLVGEHGPELVGLAPGSYVHSAPDTQAMLSGMSGGGEHRSVLELRSSGLPVDEFLLQILRKAIRVRGGDVQIVLGKGTVAL